MQGLGLEGERARSGAEAEESGRSVAGSWGAGLRLSICHHQQVTWGRDSCLLICTGRDIPWRVLKACGTHECWIWAHQLRDAEHLRVSPYWLWVGGTLALFILEGGRHSGCLARMTGWLAGWLALKPDLAAAERRFMEVMHSYFFCLSA